MKGKNVEQKSKITTEPVISNNDDQIKDLERKDSTNIGNIYHTFMQYFNFEKVENVSHIF